LNYNINKVDKIEELEPLYKIYRKSLSFWGKIRFDWTNFINSDFVYKCKFWLKNEDEATPVFDAVYPKIAQLIIDGDSYKVHIYDEEILTKDFIYLNWKDVENEGLNSNYSGEIIFLETDEYLYELNNFYINEGLLIFDEILVVKDKLNDLTIKIDSRLDIDENIEIIKERGERIKMLVK
jgi:hypothetical protein